MQVRNKRDWRVWCVTCFGLGLAPAAPGTFGTLGGVAIAWGLIGVEHYLVWLGVVALAVYFVGRALTPPIEAVYGKDPGFFVLDEVVGYLVTIAWIAPPSPLALGMGFLVFRFFDILKPPPIRRVEHLGGGDGIMLDDVVAGVYGFGVMFLLRTFFPGGEVDLWSVGVGN